MSRRPSMWHLDESHERILETINKSPHSRWFVEPAAKEPGASTPAIDAINGSGSSSQIDAADGQSVHSETTNANAPVATTAARAAKMDSPDSGSPAQGTPTLVRRSSQELQRLMQMISDFNVHRAGRLGEIEVRDGEDGNLVFDGVLRVYWGVKKPIFISSEKVEDLSPQRRRRSKNIQATDLQKMSPGGKRTWSTSAASRRRTGSGGAPKPNAEEGRGQARAKSLPDESELMEDMCTAQAGSEEDASRHRRRATVGTVTTVKTSAAATTSSSSSSSSSRLDPTPEDAVTPAALQPRHHTVSAGTPPTPRTASRRENNGTAAAAAGTAAARADSRRSSEPAIPKDGELSSTVRKAKVKRSVSTQEGQWKVLVERVNRRAKRTSYHAAIAESSSAGAGGNLLEYFIPPHGSMSNLRTDSDATTVEVIRALLKKVNAIDEPARFAVFVVKDNGEVKRLRDEESPLYRRLQLGPKEDLAKLWIMEATDTAAVSLSADVAQFYNLSMPFLRKLVERYQEEEEREVDKIREKFVAERECLNEMIEHMETEEDGGLGNLGSLV